MYTSKKRFFVTDTSIFYFGNAAFTHSGLTTSNFRNKSL